MDAPTSVIELKNFSSNAGDTSMEERLIQAIRENADQKVIQGLVEQCKNVNRIIDGMAPLHWACRKDSKAVNTLIERRANVHLLNDCGYAPLHIAANRGLPDGCTWLINARADVNVRTERGWTPLHFAANNGHKKTFHILVDLGAGVFERTRFGDTPFVFASGAGSEEIVRFYLEKGASPDDSIDLPCCRGASTSSPRQIAGTSKVAEIFSETHPNMTDIVMKRVGKTMGALWKNEK